VGVVRTWVFPILKLLVFAAIAVALVKVAFFPDAPAEDGPTQPTGSLVEPEVQAALGTVVNTVSVEGQVVADPASTAKSTVAGTVDEVFAAKGAVLAEGDPILDVKTVDEDGKERFVQVTAPVAGTLGNVKLIHGQSVQIGDAVAQVSPATFSIMGSLSADKQYRLLTIPGEATVTINGGPAPFVCPAVRVTTPTTGGDDGEEPTSGGGTGQTPGAGGTSVTCAVPGDVRVFAGLAATIELAGGTAENVLVLPTTAVKGSAGTGTVWVVGADGTQEERPVTLGLNDGQQVQIIDGLAEGDSVLQFVPGAVAPVPEGCTTLPDGSMSCEGSVG
jgi:macrolide-specific efflux system membrane fusion protein